MKKINIYMWIMCLIAVPVLLQSCSDDDYSLGNFVVRMATVRVSGESTYYLEIDNGEKLWPAASRIPWYKAVDGQRVMANYTLLSDRFEEYDHAVRVNFLWNVLTKGVEVLTDENEAEFGNDPVVIDDMWVGGNYLNILFRFRIPVNKAHRVSLVRNTTVENPADNYVHLEYRYNNENDVSDVVRRAYVSFNLGSYGPQSLVDVYYKGLKIKVNQAGVGEKEFVYEYKVNGYAESKDIKDSNDLVDNGFQ